MIASAKLHGYIRCGKNVLYPGSFKETNLVEYGCSIVSISHMPATNGNMMSAVLTRILASAQYKLVLGPSNWNDLHAFLKEIGGIAMPGEPLINSDLDSNRQVDSTAQPPLKKLRALHHQKETPPVRVLCSLRFLEQVKSALLSVHLVDYYLTHGL